MITGEGPFPSITDEQAFNSDDGGDSDAEDEMDVSTVTTRSGRSSMNNSQDGSGKSYRNFVVRKGLIRIGVATLSE